MKICLQSDHKNIKCSCLNHPYFMNSKVRFTHQLYPVVYTLAQDRTTIHKNTEVFMKSKKKSFVKLFKAVNK